MFLKDPSFKVNFVYEITTKIVMTFFSQAHQTAEAARQSGAASGQTQGQPEDFVLPAARAGHVSTHSSPSVECFTVGPNK